jgi:hypothetical protein
MFSHLWLYLPKEIPHFPAYKTHQPIRRTLIFSVETLEKIMMNVFNFSNLLEENRIIMYEN